MLNLFQILYYQAYSYITILGKHGEVQTTGNDSNK
jgi:hypothetical protein